MLVSLDDGVTTTVDRWGDSGPVLLCVHGMSGSRRSWLRLAHRFSDRYQVVAYDQRGHGDSAQSGGPWTLDRGAADVANVAAAIGGADVLVGHSWGGAVVIRAGEQTGVRGIAAIDPMIVQQDRVWYGEFIEELDALFQARDDARATAIRAEHRDWHRDDVEGKVHALHAMTTEPIAGLRDQNPPESWDLRDEIGVYPKPLLLAMAGRDDSIVPPAVMDDVAGHHPANVQIETFEGQGHSLHRTDFETFAVVLERFLKRVT